MSSGLDLSKLRAARLGPQGRRVEPSNLLPPVSAARDGAAYDWPNNWKDLLSKDIRLFGASLLSGKAREEFYLELATLLEAGVDIKSSLELIAGEQSKAAVATLFTKISASVVSGKTLSDSIRERGEFSSYEYFSVQIGEESGKLTRVLKELAGFYSKKVKQRRQIMSALSYPIVVLTTAVGAVFFMITFVVPMFSGIFRRFGGELPAVTKAVIAASAFLRSAGPLLLASVILIWFYLYSQRKALWFKKYSAQLLLKAPLFGTLIRKIYLARFSYSMTLLIGSRIPILRAIGLVREMIAFYPIESSLSLVEEDILQGVPLHLAMSRHTIYPKRMVSLIKVGEEVNQLEQFFDKIATQYNEEVEYQTSVISSVIEPVIIIFLGVIVGVILISMYLPLFKLGSSF